MDEKVIAGQAIYSKIALLNYDLFVLGFSNHLLWKCPTRLISEQFANLVTENHLDVGVGTGYYLKQHLTSNQQRIGLIDLNENSLEATATAIQHLQPEIYRRNILEPLALDCKPFDSVSLNYLLHCLPGNMAEKSLVFSHLKEVTNDGGRVFGSTLLGQGVKKNYCAQKLMAFYNKKGIFCNENDDLLGLKEALVQHFSDVKIEVVGCAALFSASN